MAHSQSRAGESKTLDLGKYFLTPLHCMYTEPLIRKEKHSTTYTRGQAGECFRIPLGE